jgi:adenylate cyclase
MRFLQDLIRRHGLDKIKTIGDAYMAAGGLRNQIDHPLAAVRTAKDMLSYIQRRNQKQTIKWEMRVGIHCGPVVGGLIGSEKLSFDLWGDTVNLASRIESSGLANRINISAHMYELIKDEYPCSYRGKIEVKDKGKVDLYYINGPR